MLLVGVLRCFDDVFINKNAGKIKMFKNVGKRDKYKGKKIL